MTTKDSARRMHGPDGPIPPAQFRTGIVRSLDLATTPHTCSVDLGGVTVSGLIFPGWWDAETGATVTVLVQGPRIEVINVASPARRAVGAHNHTTAPTNPTPPPAPPAAPTAPAARRTVSVTANASSSWAPAYGNWRSDGVYQGGGSAQRGFWYYGSKIATAKGSGTIVAATVFIRRATSGGINGGANVRVGTHTHASQPATGGSSHSNVARLGTLEKGKGRTFALTAAQVSALNAGAVGVGLEPGALGYVTADYFIGQPRSAGDWSGVLTLTIEG